jgi:hypothetical protein
MAGGSGPGNTTPSLYERFKDLMCKLYEAYGGDCSQLPWHDEGVSAVANVQAEFDAHGLPSFSNPSEEQQFWNDVDELEDVCGETETPPSAQAKADALSLIGDFRDANGS